jgi:hypothetical protein
MKTEINKFLHFTYHQYILSKWDFHLQQFLTKKSKLISEDHLVKTLKGDA